MAYGAIGERVSVATSVWNKCEKESEKRSLGGERLKQLASKNHFFFCSLLIHILHTHTHTHTFMMESLSLRVIGSTKSKHRFETSLGQLTRRFIELLKESQDGVSNNVFVFDFLGSL